MQALYDRRFFDSQGQSAFDAARVVVPMVLEHISPSSIVDVGCGEGEWLKIFMEHGIHNVLGIDGPHVDKTRLHIPLTHFSAQNLERPTIEGRFDLAVSLEVVEHLSPAAGKTLINALAEASDYVLFSAAIPLQGGTGHINERWPYYWQEIFNSHGFERLDLFRPRIWKDKRIAPYYRQNIFFYTNDQRMILNYDAADDLEIVDTAILKRLGWVQPPLIKAALMAFARFNAWRTR